MVNVQNGSSLFLASVSSNDFLGKNEAGRNMYSKFLLVPKEENRQLYDSLGPKKTNQTTVVIIPIFTMMAYSNHGFYDYYAGICNEKCLTVNVDSVDPALTLDFRSSSNAYQVFKFLGYNIISDADVDEDPSILRNYNRVILLHNEYVTQKEFDAITNHPKVIYLYPNALHAKVSLDFEGNSITLLRGHGYPKQNIENGFDWKYDNTHPYEYNTKCNDLQFYKIDNGFMLNCYPENIILSDVILLQTLLNL
ncbi:MAG: hypothetical protein K8Q89_04210 [Nitrosarchaeum sp.]|nr:hypothetical protein [Nitrosarchaeum sp.]